MPTAASTCLEEAIPASDRRNLVAWFVDPYPTGACNENHRLKKVLTVRLVGDMLDIARCWFLFF